MASRKRKPQRLWGITYCNCDAVMPDTLRELRASAISDFIANLSDETTTWAKERKYGHRVVRVTLAALCNAVELDEDAAAEPGNAWEEGYAAAERVQIAELRAMAAEPRTVPCDCGCGRPCCTACGSDVGPGGTCVVTEKNDKLRAALSEARGLVDYWRTAPALLIDQQRIIYDRCADDLDRALCGEAREG